MVTTERPGRDCGTCRHPARVAIEQALASGRYSIRGVSRHFAIDPESLRRHVRNHLDPEVRDALRAVPGVSALSVADRLLGIADMAHEIRVDALLDGKEFLARSLIDAAGGRDA